MALKVYLRKVYESRYFWMHLARLELKNKFRRSKLGIMWTFISPFLLTMIMSVVFSTVFHQDIFAYTPYILSGILFWDILSSSFSGGSFVIIGNDAFLRQFDHPVSIYTLKSAIVYTVSFLIAMLSLVIWVLFTMPENLLIGAVSLPLTVLIMFAMAWGGTTIAAFTCTKYRDYPQMIPLVLQTIWYVSPVFFQEEMFEQNEILYAWFRTNPITHILYLLRKPFLHGELPSLVNYLVAIAFVAVIDIFAVYINRKNARNIIFYI